MILDEKLRWFGFWLLDALKGKKVRTYYDQIRRAWKEGTSIAETEERIRALIAHAVETTEFYKNYPADSALTDLPVVNKDTFRQNYDRFLSKTYKWICYSRLAILFIYMYIFITAPPFSQQFPLGRI